MSTPLKNLSSSTKNLALDKKPLIMLIVAALTVSLFIFFATKPERVFADTNSSTTISLKSTVVGGKFITTGNAGTSALTATSASVWFGELFDLEDLGGGDFALKSRANNLYVTVSATSTLTASQTSAATINEKFKKIVVSANIISLQSNRNNKYVTLNSSNQIIASQSTNTTSAEQFQLSSPYNLNKTIRVLEVTESGVTDLNVNTLIGNTTNNIITFETYSMKKFVALRGDIDGKYDAIYIGKGIYNPTGVAAGAANTGNDAGHNTRAILNDITNLKASEIVTNYINKGLPVIFYNDSASNNGLLYQGKLAGTNGTTWTSLPGKLYNTFATYYSTTPKSNVLFVSSVDLASTTAFLNKTNLLQIANIRPRISLTLKPTDFTVNQDNINFSGNTLTYKFNVSNTPSSNAGNLVVNLYMGIDYVLSFGTDQLVATKTLSQLDNNEITFRLPAGYSGLHYWKLEIVDSNTKLKDTETGLIRFRDNKTVIKVLQVLPNNGTSSSLTLNNNLNQSYLSSEDYNITISTMDIAAFNTTGYLNLNGKYDMIIFGFTDSYNNYAPINENASIAVRAFILTGQSVMFTHDTIFNNGNSNNQNWLNYFQAATGQIAPWTNMGYGAPQPSTTTKKVNDGILTQFPFYIGNATPLISQTHDQYYTLDLEDANIIPWYNITGGTRDIDRNEDSWNHFYTYSKGNVTYSGTGHTSANFPDWEQRLFVNTMYRAFIGSNHAPSLYVYSPIAYSSTSNNIISSDSDIYLSFMATDYDLNDSLLYSTIEYKLNNSSTWTTVKTNNLTEIVEYSGNVINKSIPNPLPNGGNMTIRITTKDKSNAIVTKEVTVKIAKVIKANIVVNRTLPASVDSRNKVEKNSRIDLSYFITPISFPYVADTSSDLIVRSIHYQETFPAGMEIMSIPSIITNQSKTGNLTTGFTVSGDLPNIQYRQEGSNYVADSIGFIVSVKIQSDDVYLLDKSKLSFNDFKIGTLTPEFRELSFNTFSFQGITKITSLSIIDAQINLNESSKLFPTYAPLNASNKDDFTWESSDPSIVSINQSGNYTGNKKGTAHITVRATDGSGLFASNTIIVKAPVTNIEISGPKRVYKNQSITLTTAFLPIDADLIGTYNWSIIGASNALVTSNGASATITGLNKGTARVQVTLDGKNAIYDVTILEPLVTIEIKGSNSVYENRTISLSTLPTPLNSDIAGAYTWSVDSGKDNLELVSSSGATALFRGIESGIAMVSVTVDGIKSSNYKVTILKPVAEVLINGSHNVTKNTSIDLTASYLPVNAVRTGSGYTWNVTGTNAALTQDGSSTATLRGLSIGPATVTATLDGITSASFPINVVIPLESISIAGPDSVYKNKTITLNTTNLRPTDAVIVGTYAWRIVGGSNASIVGHGATATLTGLNKGPARVQVTVDGVVSGEYLVNVKEPVASIVISGSSNILKDSTITLTAAYLPGNADLSAGYTYTWTVSRGGANVAITSSNGPTATFKGLDIGSATITVTLDEITSQAFPVEVVTGLSLIPTYKISLGGPHNLYEQLTTNPSVNPDTMLKIKAALIWSSSASSIVSVHPDTGIITGNKEGSAKITVQYKGNPATQTSIIIKVEDGDRY